ncbi:MAG: hydantoinase B/oxoprolinase family protein [Ramlibacter sp.]
MSISRTLIGQMLIAAAQEMSAKLMQSAFSPILREARDGSCALLDREGNVVAQAESIPIQLGSLSAAAKPCLAKFPIDTLGPDDFLIVNDPFHGGQHLHDVFIFSPIHVDGHVLGIAASVAHHVDVGGTPSTSAADMHEEGLVIPPTRVDIRRDWRGGMFESLLRANVRLADAMVGDIDAQLAANAVGEMRVRALAGKHGAEAVTDAMASLIDYSERRLRAAIAALPDGTWRGEAVLDDDGVSPDPLVVRASVTIAGDQVRVDFAGTCEQAPRNLNNPFASTVAAAVSCLKSILTDASIPYNEGVARPIEVVAPLGCLLNPRPGAPTRSRMQASYRAFNAVMGAMAQAAPERAIAQGFDTTTGILFSQRGPAGYRVSVEVFGGGYGASSKADGCDAVDSPLSNCANTPVEAMDAGFPFIRLTRYALAPDSFGEGAQRGGAGFVRSYEVLGDGVTLVLFGDRFKFAAKGLFGGADGQPGRCIVHRDGESMALAAKSTTPLRRGDRVDLHLGGGGGYGDPALRDAEAVHADLRSGLLTTR